MEQQKRLHANAYAHWNEEEDNKLTEYYKQGLSISEIASLMNRNTGGIFSRIKKLGLEGNAGQIATASASTVKNEKRNEYKQELDKLTEMKAEIDRKIEELRKKIE